MGVSIAALVRLGVGRYPLHVNSKGSFSAVAVEVAAVGRWRASGSTRTLSSGLPLPQSERRSFHKRLQILQQAVPWSFLKGSTQFAYDCHSGVARRVTSLCFAVALALKVAPPST